MPNLDWVKSAWVDELYFGYDEELCVATIELSGSDWRWDVDLKDGSNAEGVEASLEEGQCQAEIAYFEDK